jgi:hypothetical protein
MVVFIFGAFANLSIVGSFRIWGGTGLYTSVSLFSNRLFTPENGPTSQEIYDQMQQCEDLEPSCKTVPVAGWHCIKPLFHCLEAWGNETNATKLQTAYIEALRSRPLAFAKVVFRETINFLSVPVNDLTAEGSFWFQPTNDEYCRMFDLANCEAFQRTTPAQLAQRDAVYNGVMEITRQTRATTQLYLALAPLFRFADRLTKGNTAGLVWVEIAILLFLTTRGQTRVMTIACMLFISYLALVAAAVSVILPRYTQTLSPFHIVISITALLSWARIVFWHAVPFTERMQKLLTSRREQKSEPTFPETGT